MASELIETDLYNGVYHLVHNPKARGSQPRYVVTDGENVTKPKGVTTILGATLSKDLMQWAVDCCVDVLTSKLPDITADDLTAASTEYIRRRESGAGTGSEAHALVERFLKGEAQSLLTSTQEAKNAYGAFVKWFNKVEPTVINVEQVIYSENFEYAGTYDCMLEIDGKVYLCDLKTTNTSRKAPKGVYAEHFVQMGAYAAAHEEQRLYELANGGTDLQKIDGLMVISARKDGKLDIVTNDDIEVSLDDCMEMFRRVVNLFRFMQFTTKQLGGR